MSSDGWGDLNFDFQASLTEKIAALKPSTPVTRRTVYDEAREALRQYVRASAPNIPVPAAIARQRELEAAILAIETEARRHDPPLPPRPVEPPRSRPKPAPVPPPQEAKPEPEKAPEPAPVADAAPEPPAEGQALPEEEPAPADDVAEAPPAPREEIAAIVPEQLLDEPHADAEEEVANVAAPRKFVVYAAVAGLAIATIVVIVGFFWSEFDRVSPRTAPQPSAPAGRGSVQPPAAVSELFTGTGFGVAAQEAMKEGKAALARGQYDKAIAAFDDAIRFEPGHAAAYGNRAFAYWSKGAAEPAIRDYSEAIAREPGNHANRFNRAVAFNRVGDYERAVADLDEVIRAEPANASALNSRCWARALLGHLDEALADCNEALRITPKDAHALDSRGFVHLKSGRLQRAVADYDAALKLDPKLATSLYGRGVARIGRGDRAGGTEDVAAARKLDPAVQALFARYGVR